MLLCKALKNAKSYEDIRNILDKPKEKLKVKISIFGVPKISIKGYLFSISVDDLAFRIERMVEKNFEFTEEERVHGKLISSKIDFFYSEIEKQEKKINCITKIFRHIYRHIDSTKVFWQQEYCRMFDAYTKKQYEKKFGHSPAREAQWMVTDLPDRWFEPEL